MGFCNVMHGQSWYRAVACVLDRPTNKSTRGAVAKGPSDELGLSLTLRKPCKLTRLVLLLQLITK